MFTPFKIFIKILSELYKLIIDLFKNSFKNE